MATPDLTAGQVMDTTAALMNDAAKQQFTYAVQIPYLNMALRELQELFELNEVPVVDTVSAEILVLAGQTEIGFAPTPPIANTPYLPNDLIELRVVWERQQGVFPYTPMIKLDFLPRYDERTEINQFLFFVWQTQKIKVLAANQNNQLKLDYIKNLFATVTTSTDQLGVINAESFLQFRTAGLLAEFIAENPTRATSLNGDAGIALERSLGISTKGRQAISIRHRPFRASYKRKSYM